MKKNIMIVLLISIFCSLCFTGCDNKSQKYTVYYINADGTNLSTEKVNLSGSTKEKLDKMIAVQEKHNQKNGYKYYNFSDSKVEGNIAYIYLTTVEKPSDFAYSVLGRAAIVKNSVQIEGIDYVALFIDGLVAGSSEGAPIGLMNLEDFAEEAKGNVDELKRTDLKLYYANAKGDKLMPVTVSVAYKNTVPVEKVILEQLISGTNLTGCYKTLPNNLKLLGVSVKDGVCYVNFDSEFLMGMVNVSAQTVIYSIVNSLCELEKVQKVQILVNGDSSKMFRETISLSSAYSYNADIIERKENQNTTLKDQ